MRISNCRAVVVRDTLENFDGMEKEFGFSKREERDLTQRTQRGRGGGRRESKRAGQAPPLQSGMRAIVRQR